MTDPIADYLTRLRNAIMAHHRVVEVPASNLKKSITKILFEKGYILNEDDFDELFYEADENDDKEIIEFFETLYDDEPERRASASIGCLWQPFHHVSQQPGRQGSR